MPTLDKKALSERDICSKFITPALVSANIVDYAHRDPAELLAEYQKARPAVAEVREKLRKELESALMR